MNFGLTGFDSKTAAKKSASLLARKKTTAAKGIQFGMGCKYFVICIVFVRVSLIMGKIFLFWIEYN